MDKEKVIEFLEENELFDVELLSEQKDLIVTKFYYDFDETELKAATAYAEDECGSDKNDDWYNEYYIPYLTEIAIDNVGDIIEEVMEELNIKAQFVSYEMEKDNDYSEFIAIFYNGNEEKDIEEVLSKLGI